MRRIRCGGFYNLGLPANQTRMKFIFSYTDPLTCCWEPLIADIFACFDEVIQIPDDYALPNENIKEALKDRIKKSRGFDVKLENSLIIYPDWMSEVLFFSNDNKIDEGIYVLDKSVIFMRESKYHKLADHPSPTIHAAIENYMLENYIQHPEPKSVRVMLGCDPELTIVTDNYTIISASDYFDVEYGDPEDEYYDAPDTDDLLEAPIGIDGAQRELEIRPDPVRTPAMMVENITELISRLDNGFGYLTTSFKRPLGGHIHITVTTRDGHSIRLYPNAAGQLWKLCDFFLQPLFLVDKINCETRREHGYLSLPQAVRVSHFNGIEYRRPSSLWLTRPSLTKVVFSLIKKVVEYYFTHLFTVQEFTADKRGPTLAAYAKIGAYREGRKLRSLRLGIDFMRDIKYHWTGNRRNIVRVDPNSFQFETCEYLESLDISVPTYIYGLKASRGDVLALRNNLRSCEKLIPASVYQFAKEITGKPHSQIGTPDHLKSRHAVILIGLSRSLREVIEETKNYKALGDQIITLVKAGLVAPKYSTISLQSSNRNQSGDYSVIRLDEIYARAHEQAFRPTIHVGDYLEW